MSVNSNTLGQNKLRKRSSLTDSNLLLIITIAVFFVMYTSAVIYLKQGFLKPQMFFNILNENASLLVLSCGMTLVMITGGIDISVGGVVALRSVIRRDDSQSEVEQGGKVALELILFAFADEVQGAGLLE